MAIRSSRDLRLLAAAAGLSALGDFMAIFPLILHVQQHTGSAVAVSAVIFALWGPVVLAAGLAGALVDRFDNRRLLVLVSFGQAGVVAAMIAGVAFLPLLLGLTALLGLGVAVSQAAEFALVPAAAGEGTSPARANALMETVRSLGFAAGPLAGAALGAAGLLWLALAADAISFAIVGMTAMSLRANRRPERAGRRDAVRARDGFAFILGQRDLAVVLCTAVAALLLFSMSAPAEPFFVTDDLGAGNVAYGVLLSAWTVGMLAGAAGAAPRVTASRLAVGGAVAIIAQGLGIAGGALAATVWVAAVGFALGGLAHGAKNVLLRSLIHERAPEALRGRAFAAYNGARNGAELGALVLGGLLVGAVGARSTLLMAGLGPAAIGVVGLLLLTTRRRARVGAFHTTAITTTGGITHARVQG